MDKKIVEMTKLVYDEKGTLNKEDYEFKKIVRENTELLKESVWNDILNYWKVSFNFDEGLDIKFGCFKPEDLILTLDYDFNSNFRAYAINSNNCKDNKFIYFISYPSIQRGLRQEFIPVYASDVMDFIKSTGLAVFLENNVFEVIASTKIIERAIKQVLGISEEDE